MKKGDLVYVRYDGKKKYYLFNGSDTSTFRRKYYILIDTKTGNIETEYDFKVKLVCAS